MTKSKINKNSSAVKPDKVGSKFDNIHGYLFIAPFFITFLIFGLYPIINTFFMSFTDYNGGFTPGEFIGLDNYARVLSDPYVVKGIQNTIIIWGLNIVTQIGLAFILLMIFTDIKYRVKGLKAFRVIFYLPSLVAATSVALIFGSLLDTNTGFINEFLLEIGVINGPIAWLETAFYARTSTSLIQTWMTFGGSFLFFMAAAQAVNKELYEVASIDGAGRFRILTSVTIPSIKPILIYIGITSLIGGLQIFDLPKMMTDGRGAPNDSLLTIVMYSYNQAFVFRDYGYSAAIAYSLFVMIIVSTIIFTSLMNRKTIVANFKKRSEERKLKKSGGVRK